MTENYEIVSWHLGIGEEHGPDLDGLHVVRVVADDPRHCHFPTPMSNIYLIFWINNIFWTDIELIIDKFQKKYFYKKFSKNFVLNPRAKIKLLQTLLSAASKLSFKLLSNHQQAATSAEVKLFFSF